MAEGVIKKILAAELQQQVLDDNIEVYPVTATSAVFDSKTNQSLDDILSSINTRIIQAAASGGGGNISIAGQTYVWAFAGFKGDSDAIDDIQEKANIRGIPSGWQESSNVNLQDGEMLYMTTARKQGDKWLTWTDGSIWSTPVRLGSSGTTSGTGSDGQGYNYIYCRTSTGQMPLFNVSVDFTELINSVELASTQGEGILVQEINGNVFYEPSMDPTGVWYDHPDGVTATIPYEWILVYQGTKDNWVPLTPQPILWSKYGVNGQDGDGVEYVFCTIQDTDNAPVIVENDTIKGTVNGNKVTIDINTISTNNDYQQDDFIPDGWYDQPQEVNQLHPKQYVSIRKKKWVADEEKSKWGLFTEPKIWSEIPIVVSGLDKLSIDWSNDNVNVVTGESGDSLKAATDNYLTVKLGDTLLPYLIQEDFDTTEYNSYYISNVDIISDVVHKLESYSDEEDASAPALARFYITSLPGTQRLYTVKFTLKVRVNGTVYTQYSTINVYVKDVAYELVVSPKGFNLSAIDTAAQQNLTVRVKMRNATTNRFLTGTEIKNLDGTFRYKFIKDNTNNEPFVNIISDENITSDTFTIDCTGEDILDQCRAIEIELTSKDGYEDSETIMIARDGNTGDEGSGIEYIFYLATEDIIWVDANGDPQSDDNPVSWSANKEPEYIPENSDWTDDLQEVTESHPVQYVSVRRFKKHGEDTTKSWGTYEPPVVYNRWVPSPYSMSISNDSVIIDDNTDSITLANASFCQLHIFSGQDEITTDSNYTFQIKPLANNGANDIFNLYQASNGEISTINNSQLIDGDKGTLKPFGGSIPIEGADGGIAFYIKRQSEDTTLAINSYGIQYQVIINKAGSQVASLYKVQPIKVANFSADGTIYKLNITNDTWTYNGDTEALVSSTNSIVTVAQIKGATANQMTFSMGSEDPPSNSQLYVKTSLSGTLATDEKSYSISAVSEYPDVSSYSLELYFNGVLVDAETIDCRKDGKTGAAGISYYLTCDNDNIIIDLDTTNNTDIQSVSTYNLQLWKSGEPVSSGVDYYVELPGNNPSDRHNLNIANQNNKESYFQIINGYTLIEGSFQATATASINGVTVASKIINVIIKQLKGTGVSYKLMVSPNTLLYEYDSANTSYSTTTGATGYPPSQLSATVVKISEGKAVSITESELKNHNLVLSKPTVGEYSYSKDGYDFTLQLDETVVDIEHVDCIVQGTNGIDGKNGDTLTSNATMYIDLSDPEGPSLNINANFYAKDAITYCYIYWGDYTQNFDTDTQLAQVRSPQSTEATITIKIPYQYIVSSFNKSSPEVLYTTSSGQLTSNTIQNGWGTCTHITLVTKSKSGAIDTKVVYRTGTEGYYFDTTSNHFISAFSKAENIHPQVTDDTIEQFTIGYINKDKDSQKLYQATTQDGKTITADYNGKIYVGNLHAATIDENGTIKTNSGFTLVTDNITNNSRIINLQPTSIQKKSVTDTEWNFGQNESILQVDTVLCNQWTLYYNQDIPSIPNQDYVVSFYMRLVESVDNIQTTVRVEGCNGRDKDSNYSAGILTTTWKRFFIKGHNDNSPTIRLVMGANTTQDFTEVVTFELGGFQITRGSDLAPWAPYSGETMSVLLQTSKEFNSTVSQVTTNKTNISQIQQQADNIQVKVNSSGLEVTDTGTTFTGDVNATNFNVCDSQNRAVMQVLVATQELTLDNSSKIAIGEPYIKLNTYKSDGTVISKYVGLYSLKDNTATDRLTYTTTTYLGVPTSAIDKTNPKIDYSSSYYTLISKIKLDGVGVTNINIDNTNYDIYNNQVWVQENSASATVSEDQVSCTGTYVSNPFVLTTKCNTLSQPNYYIVENDIIYPITKLTYGDRIQIDNDSTMLSIRTYWVCGVCAIESATGIAYWLNYRKGSFSGVLAGQQSIELMTIPGYFERVNSIEDSNFPLFMENL